MSDIFISYSSKDRDRAKVLAGALEHQGWSVWWDRKIPPGRQFSQVIKEAMDEARCIIVLWSKESVKSEWVQNEAAEGARRKILVPALIDNVEIPFEFRRIQAARLVDWEGRSPHPEFDTLLEALCAILGQPLLPKASEPIPDEQQPVNEIHTLAEDKPKDDRPMDTTISKEPKKLQTTKVLAAICIVTLIAIISTGVFLKYLQPKTYELDIHSAVGGSVTKDPNKVSYKDGETVNLKADPNTGYSFMNWSGDLSDSNNPTTLVMDADKSVTASFVLKIYSLTATAVGGSVKKSPDKASYKHGETVTLEAAANAGYNFTNWSGDLSDSNNPTTLVMDTDKSVTAGFALKAGNVVTNSIGMKLVYIPAGKFIMGSSVLAAQLGREYGAAAEDWSKDQFPQHPVSILESFWMGQTEVTQGQYESVMKDKPWSGKKCVVEDPNNPAVYVKWVDANDFCNKLSEKEGKTYRLPTEAEWEYACRAGTTNNFSFGDNHLLLGDYAWFLGNKTEEGLGYAHEVGQKKSNPWGLYDMHGNVWEYCSDWYDKDYYSDSPSVDPKGPSNGTHHVARGGAWSDYEYVLRCSARLEFNPGEPIYHSLYGFGFRVVCEP